MTEPLVGTEEAARILNLSAKNATKMAKRGEIPAIQLAWRWGFRALALDKWVDERMKASVQPPAK
jgi:excisionase family DNA binding protein